MAWVCVNSFGTELIFETEPHKAVWFVLYLLVGALIFEGIRSLAKSNAPAKKIGMSVFTEEGHDYLVVDTKHGVCVVHA